jgi:hypothetical protein
MTDVDLRALKAGASRLPTGHPLRDAVLGGPDTLPREAAYPLLAAWLELALALRRR